MKTGNHLCLLPYTEDQLHNIAIIQTQAQTVIDDYGKILELIDYQSFIKKELGTIVKINFSWPLFYPACSTPVYRLDGVLRKLIDDGANPEKIIPTGNQTKKAKEHLSEKGSSRCPKNDINSEI